MLSWILLFRNSPFGDTDRIWMMYLTIGLFPSKPGAQLTFAKWGDVVLRTALRFVGAYGSSTTDNRADLVALPPSEETRHSYSPTSDALTSRTSSVPSGLIEIREFVSTGLQDKIFIFFSYPEEDEKKSITLRFHSPSVLEPGNGVLDSSVGRHLALKSGNVTEDDLCIDRRLGDPRGD